MGSMISGKERKQERFIDVFLFQIAGKAETSVCLFSIKFFFLKLLVLEDVRNVKILLEHELNGIEVPVNSNVEYAMIVEGKIILLLEVKADNFAMGRAQNYVECKVRYEVRLTCMLGTLVLQQLIILPTYQSSDSLLITIQIHVAPCFPSKFNNFNIECLFLKIQ